MLTGTPLDLTPFGPLLRGLGLLCWLLALAVLGAALWWVPRWFGKAIASMVVIGAFGYLPIAQWLVLREARAQQRAAYEHFQARCKEAGERIVRRETGVEGVLLMKIRPASVNYDDQFTPDDVYGRDRGGDEYIKSFLRVTVGSDLPNAFGEPLRDNLRGYAWVEASSPGDGRLYRYTLVNKVIEVRSDKEWDRLKKAGYASAPREARQIILDRKPIEATQARYGVTWADISTREDRTRWVAGGVIQVVDLSTQEVIAERKGFMWDYGMGSRAGGEPVQNFVCEA
jgi:hypothetical protein